MARANLSHPKPDLHSARQFNGLCDACKPVAKTKFSQVREPACSGGGGAPDAHHTERAPPQPPAPRLLRKGPVSPPETGPFFLHLQSLQPFDPSVRRSVPRICAAAVNEVLGMPAANVIRLRPAGFSD